MYFNIILQVAEVPTNIWTRIADQGLLISLLALAVYVLWKRDSAMNEKMNKYLDEDRKEMLTVISNNTKAFEDLSHTMKDILHQNH